MGQNYSVGREILSDYEIPECEYIVYSYYIDGYEGGGEAIIKKDNKYYYYDLGHCSCYGPLEGNPIEHSLQEILSDKVDIHDLDVCQEIKDKIRELENMV